MGMKVEEHSLIASITRESFYEFLVEFWDTIVAEPPVFSWHIRYLCDQLQIVAERVFQYLAKQHDLVINVPPGSTKSTICSQMFPAWVWTRMPHAQFICASYSHSIALKDSVRMRDIVQSQKYQRCFPHLQLREDVNTKGLFVNTCKGFRFSTSIGGSVTGQHGHFMIVDDPINPEEALSEADLKKANRWMESTLPSRRMRFSENVVPTILIQQRLHQDDPSGRMVERKGKGVLHICLPGEMEGGEVQPPELASHYVDGLLDPVRLSRETLDELKVELGAYSYAAQILQSPVPLGGGDFKVDQFRLVDVAPLSLVRRIRSWDKAGTEGGGKFSAGVLMGVDSQGFYWVLDVVRGQWGATRREATIRQTAELDGRSVEVRLEVEGGSGGKESGESTVRNLAGYRVSPYHPTGDKRARAYAYASQVGAGNVYVLKRPWTKAYIEELRFFPHGTYSDQVDASSGAFNALAKKKVRVGGMRMTAL